MNGFGFYPGDGACGPVSAPVGYGSATVHLGDTVESVFFNLAIWNAGDYVQHWRLGASKCLRQRQPFLFCSDLTKQNATVFAAFPEGDGFWFEQWVIPRRAFTVSGQDIVLAGQPDMVRAGGDTSCWWVDRAAILDFAGAV